jgi:hypothetical protein
MEGFFERILGLAIGKESFDILQILLEEVNLQGELFFNETMFKGFFGLSRSYGVSNDKGLEVFLV